MSSMLQKTNPSWFVVSLSERVKMTLERRNRHHGSILPSSGQRFPLVVRIVAEARRDSKEEVAWHTKTEHEGQGTAKIVLAVERPSGH